MAKNHYFFMFLLFFCLKKANICGQVIMNWQELISKLAFCTGLETSPRTTTTGQSSNATMTV